MVHVRETDSQRAAHEIMGRRFTSFESVDDALDGWFTDDHRMALEEVRIPEATLRTAARDWILVPGFGGTLNDLMKRRYFGELFYPNAWDEAVLDTHVPCSWFLLRATPIVGFHRRSWSEQTVDLSRGQIVPNLAMVAYATAMWFHLTDERLFSEGYVRCRDTDSDGHHLALGDFDASGIYVMTPRNDHRSRWIGLALARLPPAV